MVDNRLNRWRREVEELAEVVIRDTDTALQREYMEMLRKIKQDAYDAINHPDNLTRTDVMRQDRRLAIAKQIQDDLRDSHPGIRETIKEGVERNAELGYYGNWYDLEQANGLEINLQMLDKKKLEQIVTKPVDGKRFSKRLYDNREKLANQVNRALIDGIEQGLGYRAIADQIEQHVDGNYKRALRIARTESMRANSEARQEANNEAQKAGVLFEKQWLATLDGVTRDSHRDLDGQRVEPDEDFESKSGNKALEPRMFGVAEEDIQCRCTTINIVGGIEPDTRMARELDGTETIDFTTYEDWKESLDQREVGVEEDDGTQIKKASESLKDNEIFLNRIKEQEDLTAKIEAIRAERAETKAIVEDLVNQFEDGEITQSYYDAKWSEIEAADKVKRLEAQKLKFELYDMKDAHTIQNAQTVKDTLSQYRSMGASDIDLKSHVLKPNSKASKAVTEAYDYYPTEWINRSVEYGELATKSAKRGYYSPGENTLAISSGRRGQFKVTLHELAHRQEQVNPEILEAERLFYEKRTSGEDLQKLKDVASGNYRSNEVTRVDDFLDPYMGKDYNGEAYELLSMGIETLYTNPQELAKDPEMFDWVIEMLLTK